MDECLEWNAAVQAVGGVLGSVWCVSAEAVMAWARGCDVEAQCRAAGGSDGGGESVGLLSGCTIHLAGARRDCVC